MSVPPASATSGDGTPIYRTLWNVRGMDITNARTIYTARIDGSDNVITLGDALVPAENNTLDIGSSSLRWREVYATNGTINTSDERLKAEILDSDRGLTFVNKLRPVSYRWKDAGQRPHYGLIAQDVQAVIQSEGKDFGGFIRDETSDVLGLRYTEFISPILKAVQELSAQVTQLTKRVAELEEKGPSQ
jgi:hypothetical protein